MHIGSVSFASLVHLVPESPERRSGSRETREESTTLTDNLPNDMIPKRASRSANIARKFRRDREWAAISAVPGRHTSLPSLHPK